MRIRLHDTPAYPRTVFRLVTLASVVLIVAGLATSNASMAGADATATTEPATTTTTAASTTVSTTAGTEPASTTTTSTNGSTSTTSGSPGQRSGAVPAITTQLNGAGSSFAAPAIENFTSTVTQQPYNLSVNYSPTSSGDGRFEFAGQTTNYAVSDIAYGLGSTDTVPPSFPFIYVPITAGGSPSCTTSLA